MRDPEKGRVIRAACARSIGDLGKPASYAAAAEQADVIVHTALDLVARRDRIDRQAVETFLAAATKSRGGRAPAAFVYTSGVWVLGDTTVPAERMRRCGRRAYVAWRPEHERLVLEAGCSGTPRTVVVRPGIVYGGTRGIIADLLKDAANGLVRVIGEGKNHWPCVYARDLADLYLRVGHASRGVRRVPRQRRGRRKRRRHRRRHCRDTPDASGRAPRAA